MRDLARELRPLRPKLVPQRRILVVASDEQERHALSIMLASHFDFIVRRTAREALACLDVEKPDLLLADWDLPDMTGLELVETIRRRGGPIVRSVIMSADASPQRKCWNARVEAFLLKPFNCRELLTMLDAVVRVF